MAYEFRGNIRTKSDPGTPTRARAVRGDGRSIAQILAFVFGLTFLLVGIAGFIPGVTENFDELEFSGQESRAELLGLFRVSILHNIVHLLFGIGIVAAAGVGSSLVYLLGGGVVYAAVTIFGFLVEEESDSNFLPLNDADNFLHVGLTAAMLLAGLVGMAVSRGRNS